MKHPNELSDLFKILKQESNFKFVFDRVFEYTYLLDFDNFSIFVIKKIFLKKIFYKKLKILIQKNSNKLTLDDDSWNLKSHT